MYITQNNLTGSVNSVWCNTNNVAIPIDPANRHYQKVLDDIIEQGADCFEGDIPTDLQTAADAKQFAQQVGAYKTAKARVAQYQLSVGVPESSETIVTGQEMNMETGEIQDVTETIVTPAIEALEATVEETTYDFDTNTSSTTTVANPLIIDTTPGPVKAHVDS
jgi:hypothetical protein